MFVTLKNKVKDVGTLSLLCKQAERVARSRGREKPGSEHFVLAALSLPDGTARRALAQLGASPEAFGDAINAQFADALHHVGVTTEASADPELSNPPRAPGIPRLYRTAPSGETMVQRLVSAAGERKTRPLLAADVLLAAGEEEFSITARALGVLGITKQRLVQAAEREVELHEQQTKY